MNERILSIYEILLQTTVGNRFPMAEKTENSNITNEKVRGISEVDLQRLASELNNCKTPESLKAKKVLPEDMQKYYICPKDINIEKSASQTIFERNGIRFIDNPYTVEETAAIREWAEDHPFDVRGLAAALWLCGGITPEAIINLKTTDCWNGDGDADKLIHMGSIAIDRSIFHQWERFRIVKRAVDLHQAKQPYVFMAYEKGCWNKLNGNSIQLKMFHICRNLGITYKKFSNNEIILY